MKVAPRIKHLLKHKGYPGVISVGRQCGPMITTSWKDNKIVYFFSTARIPECDLKTSRRKNDCTVEERPSNSLVGEYGMYMGGAGRNDKILKLNKPEKQ